MGHQPLESWGVCGGHPTFPALCLLPVQNRKAGTELYKVLVLSVISLLSPQAVLCIFFLDYGSRILPCIFKSTENVKSSVVWESAGRDSEFLLEIQAL